MALEGYMEPGGLKVKAFSGSSSGDNQGIAGVAGQIIRVYSMLISSGTATDVTFKDGAGGTSIGGPHKAALTIDLEFNPIKYPLFTCSAGNDFTVNLSAANAWGGTIWFTQSPT